MKQLYYDSKLDGFGGWLALLQVRLYIGFIALFFIPINAVLALLLGGALVLCLLLFYQYRMAFRGAYIAVSVLSIAAGITMLPVSVVYLIVQCVLEAAIILALFMSRRVKNTFLRKHERADAVDGWNGQTQRRCCYDVHYVTNRITK